VMVRDSFAVFTLFEILFFLLLQLHDPVLQDVLVVLVWEVLMMVHSQWRLRVQLRPIRAARVAVSRPHTRRNSLVAEW